MGKLGNWLFLLSLFLFSQQAGNAQLLLTTSYSTSEGLPNNIVYCAAQDRLGYLWFGTDNGLVRFDGVNFKLFSVKEGLRSPFVLDILNYSADTLAILSYRNGIDFINILNGHVRQTPMCSRKGNMFIAQKDKFYVTPYAYPFYEIFEKEKLVAQNEFLERETLIKKIMYGFSKFHNQIYANMSGGLFHINQQNIFSLAEPILKNVPVFKSLFMENGDLYVATLGKIILIRNHQIVKTFTKNIPPDCEFNQLTADHNQVVWATGRTNLLFRIKGDEISEISNEIGLEGITISGVFVDRMNNVWVLSHGRGLIKIEPTRFKTTLFNQKENYLAIDKLLIDQANTLWIGNKRGLSYLHKDENEIKLFSVKSKSKYKNIEYIIEPKPGQIIHNMDDKMFVKGNPNHQLKTKQKVVYTETETNSRHQKVIGFNSFNLIPFPKRKLYLFFHSGDGLIQCIDDSTFDYQEKLDQQKFILGRINFDLDSLQGQYYVSSDQWIMKMNDAIQLTPVFNTSGDLQLFSMLHSKTNTILVATNHGIYEFDGKKMAPKFPLSQDAAGQYCTSMCYGHDGDLWAGTNNGLYRVKSNGFTEAFKKNSGLPDNTITALQYDSSTKRLWVGTMSGLASLQVDVEPKKSVMPLNIFLSNWTANDTIQLHPNHVLTHHQNNITIQVSTPYFGNRQNLQYEYRINKDVHWKKMTGDQLYLDALSPTSYHVQLRAHDVEQQLYSATLSCSFEILAPVYQRWWFILLAILLTQFCILFVYRYYTKRKQVMTDLQHQLAMSKHETFSASINPHFIFNALNSVQHFINMNDRLNANRYLTSFAKLIRKNFNATKKMEITLAEEIEHLQLYINLEQMRQQQRFTYQLDVDESLDAEDIKIPVMIIQPFVENAILHGFAGQIQHGHLRISFQQKNHQLQIGIEDNGVGFKPATAPTSHQSSGIAITEQRIYLYGKIKGKPVAIHKQAAFPLSIAQPGYRIEIELPLIN